MREPGRVVLASDLYPRCSGVARCDFLHDPVPEAARGSVAVTNPPFNALDPFIARGLELLDRGLLSGLALLVRSDAPFTDGRATAFNRASHEFACCWRPTWIAGTKGNGRWSACWFVWRADRSGPRITRSLRRADVENAAPLFGGAA
jgi:hypothetical protein